MQLALFEKYSNHKIQKFHQNPKQNHTECFEHAMLSMGSKKKAIQVRLQAH